MIHYFWFIWMDWINARGGRKFKLTNLTFSDAAPSWSFVSKRPQPQPPWTSGLSWRNLLLLLLRLRMRRPLPPPSAKRRPHLYKGGNFPTLIIILITPDTRGHSLTWNSLTPGPCFRKRPRHDRGEKWIKNKGPGPTSLPFCNCEAKKDRFLCNEEKSINDVYLRTNLTRVAKD